MMAIRKNTDFPIYQWTALGFVFARTPEEAWHLTEMFIHGVAVGVEAHLVEKRQAVNRILHGAACDITWSEFYEHADALCCKHQRRLFHLIPGLPKPE